MRTRAIVNSIQNRGNSVFVYKMGFFQTPNREATLFYAKSTAQMSLGLCGRKNGSRTKGKRNTWEKRVLKNEKIAESTVEVAAPQAIDSASISRELGPFHCSSAGCAAIASTGFTDRSGFL
jgi:hypothetical protein